MKKSIKSFTIFSLVITMICSSVLCNPVKAAENINYTYEYDNYTTSLESVEYNDGCVSTFFIENDIEITVKIDCNFRYVVVNDLYYSYDDYSDAIAVQVQQIYDYNNGISIVEVLENYEPISNLDDYLLKNNLNTNLIADLSEGNSGILPLASYGEYYYIGQSRKLNIAASLASGAISVLLAYYSGGLSIIGLNVATVTEFVTGFLTAVGVDYLLTDAYVKKWQAVLNVGGTTSEKTQNGLKRPDHTIFWDTYFYYRTFESIRPV